MRVLIVEDEPKTVSSLKQALNENDYETDIAFDGNNGFLLAKKKKYDVIVLDVIIPGLNGMEVCKQLRDESIETPVLLLTALDSVEQKVAGLDSGADDYLVKPFEMKEFLARIRSLSRRSLNGKQTAGILQIADLEMNLETRIVSRAGIPIELTAKEFALLEYLIRNAGKVISKLEIADKVWGIQFDTGTNVIEVYVNYLRKKIDKDFDKKLIHTQHGMGYILKDS